MKQMLRRQNSEAMFLTRVSPASPLDVSGEFTTRCLWWPNQGDQNQVDRGADNPYRNIPNHHETRKEGQGPTWAVAPLMMMMMIIA
jgi:hypothetical protein